MNKLIFRCKFGSHLYGTNTEKSDLDYKSVFIPSGETLIMQTAPKHIQKNTKTVNELKNSADDIDDESFSVSQFLKLLCEGQTPALDMLFCTNDMILHCAPEWLEICASKDRFLHSGTSAFVGYTRQQAAKYGVKGFRVAALRDIITWLNQYQDYHLVGEAITKGSELPKNDQIKIETKKDNKGREETYLMVCDRMVPFHANIKYAREVYKRIFDMYGERALKAEKNEGIDWKALSHAVRVANESIELLSTGKITFPRPEMALLLQIKQGLLPYREVETLIEEGLAKVEEAKAKSSLPDKPDFKFAEQLIYKFHLQAIREVL